MEKESLRFPLMEKESLRFPLMEKGGRITQLQEDYRKPERRSELWEKE